jgi:Uma2 family endonuclease
LPYSGSSGEGIMGRTLPVEGAITIEDYLAGENDGSIRYEFLNGAVYAKAGASEPHCMIKLNIAGLLNSRIKEDCFVFDGDMKLRIQQDDDTRFYYPDVFVSCTARVDPYWRDEAVLIVEVLSPTTKRLDRYEKFEAYKALPSLMEYAFVEQELRCVDLFRRRDGWNVQRRLPPGTIQFESIGEALTFEQIYRRVSFKSA